MNLQNVTPQNRTLITAILTGVTHPSDVPIHGWSLFPTTAGEGIAVSVVGASLSDDFSAVILDVQPPMSAGVSYTLNHANAALQIPFDATTEIIPDPNDMPRAALEAFLEASGEAIHEYSGMTQTRLTRDWNPSDRTMSVESTLNFPDTRGEVWIGKRLFSYRNIEICLLRNVVEVVSTPLSIPVSAVVTLRVASIENSDIARVSQIDRANWDTLLHRATGADFDNLARFYGFPRLRIYSREAWRRVLLQAVWGVRGTPGCTFNIIQALFSKEELVFQVDCNTSDPNAVTHISGPTEEFACDHIQRLARIRFIPKSAAGFDDTVPKEDWPWTEAVFWVMRLKNSFASQLFLCPISTSKWSACNWSSGPLAVDPDHTEATLSILRFLPVESNPGVQTPSGAVYDPEKIRACLLRVLVDADLFTVPPSFLLDPVAIDRSTILPNSPPLGGHIMDLFDLDGVDLPAQGDQEDGPYPIYLPGDGTDTVAPLLNPLLVAGVHVREELRVWCPENPS